MLKIYNTLTRSKDTFIPRVEGKVGMYVCGMTVYDYCHIGHARVMVVFDIVARYLRYSGYELTYVRNVTDIDDKIIQRANENNEDIQLLTERFIRAMQEDGLLVIPTGATVIRLLPPLIFSKENVETLCNNLYERAIVNGSHAVEEALS